MSDKDYYYFDIGGADNPKKNSSQEKADPFGENLIKGWQALPQSKEERKVADSVRGRIDEEMNDRAVMLMMKRVYEKISKPSVLQSITGALNEKMAPVMALMHDTFSPYFGKAVAIYVKNPDSMWYISFSETGEIQIRFNPNDSSVMPDLQIQASIAALLHWWCLEEPMEILVWKDVWVQGDGALFHGLHSLVRSLRLLNWDTFFSQNELDKEERNLFFALLSEYSKNTEFAFKARQQSLDYYRQNRIPEGFISLDFVMKLTRYVGTHVDLIGAAAWQVLQLRQKDVRLIGKPPNRATTSVTNRSGREAINFGNEPLDYSIKGWYHDLERREARWMHQVSGNEEDRLARTTEQRVHYYRERYEARKKKQATPVHEEEVAGASHALDLASMDLANESFQAQEAGAQTPLMHWDAATGRLIEVDMAMTKPTQSPKEDKEGDALLQQMDSMLLEAEVPPRGESKPAPPKPTKKRPPKKKDGGKKKP